jgi:hypothetical protein
MWAIKLAKALDHFVLMGFWTLSIVWYSEQKTLFQKVDQFLTQVSEILFLFGIPDDG